MLFACILLMLAVSGGTLLTYLYESQSNIVVRLCSGTVSGLAVMATVGFVLSLLAGFTGVSIAISAAFMLLPWLILASRKHRQQMRHEIEVSYQQASRRSSFPVAAFYLGLALVLGLIFARNLLEYPDGIYTGVANNLGDLPFHLQVISSFVYGHNFPVEDPTYAGVRFTYPVLADFLTAMMVRLGAAVAGAMWLQGMALALAFIGLLHHWTRTLTKRRVAAIFAPLLVVFSGGLGWWLLMQDLRNNDGGLLSLLANLPRDYTIVNGSIFRFGNSVTTLLLPQRSFLFGLPLAVCIFYQWWKSIESSSGSDQASGESAPEDAQQSATRRRMIAAGICAGLLPLIHTHGFVVVVGAGFCLALLFRSLWRDWLIFFGITIIIALPEVFWLSHGSAISASRFIGWQPGWDHGNHSAVWFWFVNTGFFIPLLLAAVFSRKYAVSRQLTLFYAPFCLFFLVPNLLRLSPWIWDNIKLLFYWYVASVPLVAAVLAQWWEQRASQRWIAAGLLASLTLSGALDVLRAITPNTRFQEFTPDAITMAGVIRSLSPARALVLHAPVYNSPVFITGRRTLLGYPGWIWSRGLDYSQRETDIHTIYSGASDALVLLNNYHVDYVLMGPSEREFLTNQDFWKRCPKLAEVGEYQLYKSNCSQ